MPDSVTSEHSNDPAVWNPPPTPPARVNGHAAMPDLDDIDLVGRAEKGFDLSISNPDTSRPFEIKIRLRGRDSDALHDLDVRHLRERMELEANAPGSYYEKLFPQHQLEKAVLATMGWSEFAAFGQAPYPFSPENAARLYRKHKTWLLVDVVNGINDRKKLFQDSPTD